MFKKLRFQVIANNLAPPHNPGCGIAGSVRIYLQYFMSRSTIPHEGGIFSLGFKMPRERNSVSHANKQSRKGLGAGVDGDVATLSREWLALSSSHLPFRQRALDCLSPRVYLLAMGRRVDRPLRRDRRHHRFCGKSRSRRPQKGLSAYLQVLLIVMTFGVKHALGKPGQWV